MIAFADDQTSGDVYAHEHTNGLFIIGISNSHPVRKEKKLVTKVEFHDGVSSMKISGNLHFSLSLNRLC